MYTRIKSLSLSKQVANSGHFTICSVLQEVGVRVVDREVELDEKLIEEDNPTFDITVDNHTVHYSRMRDGDAPIEFTVYLGELEQ